MKRYLRSTWWRRRLAIYVGKYRLEGAVLMGTAVLVGFAAGVGAIVFRWLIDSVAYLCFDVLPRITEGAGDLHLVLAPALGGLLVGPLVWFFAREAKGHGVPEVMAAVALRKGRIRPVVAIVKSLASSLSIGSGGSVGREGPIVQIGSALGSSVGQWLRLSSSRVRNLVACGAAAGVAATFNAPIAGVIFALEVILGDFGVRSFGTVVVASVTASVVGRAAFGDVPAFVVPEYAINSLWEFPMYVVLGLVTALVAVFYTRAIYWSEDLFDSWRAIPEWVKPAIGGAALGAMALSYRFLPGLDFESIPQVYGVGYETIEAALHGELVIVVVLALLLLKIVATSLTVGSGGSGGVFAPGLFIGAMLGGGYGLVMQQLFPGLPGPPGAYALVGMGALFAGTTFASLTAVIIMFELTGDYKIILPLMATVVVSTLVSRFLMKGESIYTLKLTRRGVRIRHGRDTDVLEGVRVEHAMTRDVSTVTPATPLSEVSTLFRKTNRHAFPVLDDGGVLCGIVSLTDVQRAEDLEAARFVVDVMTPTLVTCHPDETLDVVLRKMGPRDLSRLPVVARDDPRRLLGVIRRNDLVRAYNLALSRRRRTED
ncbi:MAG: chloride channel protein [bacterium]|nr:chloride channel protein [bacterium]